MSSCLLCGGRGEGPLREHPDFTGSFLYRCAACSHAYCSPEPDSAALARHYRGEYAARRRSYLGRRYRSIMVRRARAQAALVARWAAPGRCLDVGCGIGALVAELGARGWDAAGLESDPYALEFGRRSFGVNLSPATLADARRSGGPFDLISLSHVVEHFADVKTQLREIAEALRAGGLLFVEVPNQGAVPEGDLESHLHFFSRRSLSRLLSLAGLEVVFCGCCGPREVSPGYSSTSLAAHVAEMARRSGQWLLGTTDWDGQYEAYHDDDRGLWIRCMARRVQCQGEVIET